MNITHIRTFWEVMKCQSFTEAAERLYTTQSTVSKNISALERELGFLLFERRGRAVALTPAGKLLLKDLGDILAACDRAESTVAEIRRQGRQEGEPVRFMMVPAVEQLGIISGLNRFTAEHASFKPAIEVTDEAQILQGLQTGYCDLAFCSDLKLDAQRYELLQYSANGFYLVMSRLHPLAGRGALHLRELEGQELILMHPESMLWQFCVDACQRAGFHPTVVFTTCRQDVAVDYVRSARCIYMTVDFGNREDVPEDCVALPLLDSPRFRYVFAWRKGAHGADVFRTCAAALAAPVR